MLLMTALAVFLAAASGAAAKEKPGNGGPFQDFQQSQLVFVPPSNVTQVNGATFDMIAGLKSECKCHLSCWQPGMHRWCRLTKWTALLHVCMHACSLVVMHAHI